MTTSSKGASKKRKLTHYPDSIRMALKRRNVYAAPGTQDLTIIEEPHETQFFQDIDTPLGDFYQVYQTKHSRKPPTPLSGFQRDHSRKPDHSTPKKPSKKYDGNRKISMIFPSISCCSCVNIPSSS